MLTVKVSTNFKWCLERQTPNNSGIWGDCRFLVNQDVTECDYWVVFDGLLGSETTRCRHMNTLLITGEPPDVKGYAKRFLAQFGAVLTCNHDLKHHNLIFNQVALPWLIGAELNPSSRFDGKFMSYEELSQPVVDKKRLLSIVISNREATKGHVLRSEFIEKLIGVIGNEIDVYGFGRQPVPDKWDVIAPYKYHLTIENSVSPDYWTEKLADAFLGEAMPIYHGCPNIYDYFPRDSMVCIDINKPDIAIDTIVNTIRSDRWSTNRDFVLGAKRKVMVDYNFFNVIDQLTHRRTVHEKSPNVPQTITMQPEPCFHGGIFHRLFHTLTEKVVRNAS